MRKFFLTIPVFLSFFFSSCEEKEYDFETWAKLLTWEEAEEMLQSPSASFMRDVRTLPSIGDDFSCRDEVTKQGDISVEVSYPYTLSEGKTIVFYEGEKIFEESWGTPIYMGANMMTQVMYGQLSGTSCLRITNQTKGSNGESSSMRHWLFLDTNGRLKEIDLQSLGVAYDLWIGSATAMEGVLIIHTTDFVRMIGRQEHIILLDIHSGQSRKMDREVKKG